MDEFLKDLAVAAETAIQALKEKTSHKAGKHSKRS